jgi:LacI family transcriptional regulator
MAAEYFIEKGYTQFAFCGYKNLYYSDLRANAFGQHVQEHGFDCDIYKPYSKNKLKALNMESDIDHIALWLKSLPHPTAILACNDNRAANIIEAAKIAPIKIPEEVALLGIDNDELICNMCNPSLSSIQLNSEHGGYELAALLDDLMHGRTKMAGQTIAVDPIKVIERMSTDVLKVADSDVAAALNFIKENRKYPIQVSDVVEAACTSRSGLQKKFRWYLDRTIAEEITKSRIDYIKQLLLDTDYSISRIAEIINMPSISVLSRFFQKSVGMSPLQYRKKYQSSEQ